MDQLDSDSAYFHRRASEEQAAAERASDPRARQSHIDLAERYADAARTGSMAANSNGSSGSNGSADLDEGSLTPPPLLQPEFRILP